MAENFYGNTDKGKMRDNNEDNFIAQKISGGRYIVGCVIDGVGGYDGGEIAASLTRTAILNTLKNASGNIIHLLKTAVIEASKKIFEKKSNGEYGQMACVLTLALADIKENVFYYAHVGDTRLYLLRDNSLVKVTHDHSFVGFLEESGRLTEDAAMNHPKRNEINKALGFDEEKFLEEDYIETGESPFLPGDTLLLCSDGLSDMLNARTITGILSSPRSLKEKSAALIEAANLAGGRDNITVVLIHNDKSPSQYEATKPVAKESIVEETPVVTKVEPVQQTEIIVKRKGGGAGLRFLIVLCLLMAAALAWFIYNDYFKQPAAKELITEDAPFARNDNVLKLSDSIRNNTSGTVMLKNIYGNTQHISLNDSLLIKNDTLHIIGNGVTLQPDTAYSGAAFVFSANCKYVLLDSINFENFNTALIVRNKNVYLKNIRFTNCINPVVYNLQLPADVSLSGHIADTSVIKIDSAKTFIQTR